MYRIIEEKCTGCGRCFDACPSQAIILVDRKAQIDDARCTDCGSCLDACPAGAIVVRSRTLQKIDTAGYDIESACDQRPAPVHSPTKGQLLLNLCDLFLKVADIFVDSYSKPVPTASSSRPQPLQNRPLQMGNCQRRRRGGGGKGGRSF
ncbi:MAG TPA: 4Fe-4S binding protein [bacterium]|jgi:Fe-S-cluster-containing hydrogenase component 2|nr:4Fe-4S binding protein [bacterium]HOZ22428.1 4Fe-4S binding protein [bacterium]